MLLATFLWLFYMFYHFNIGIYSRHVNFPTIVEDIPGVWGLAFFVAGASISLIVVVLHIIQNKFSRLEAVTGFRFALLFLALYFAGTLGGALNVWKNNYFTLPRILEQGLPCLVEGIVLPAILIKLFFELAPNKPRKGAVKWALIFVTSFILVYWLNNMGVWVGTVLVKGPEYLTQYPINMLSFIVTVAGLLLLALYSASFSAKWLRIGIIEKLDWRKIGTIITLLAIYPVFIFILWLFFGAVGGWGPWYAWFLGHGYLTFIVLPAAFISLPLLFRPNTAPAQTQKRVNALIILTQTLGATFFVVFSLAYYITIPSRQVLIGTEPFYSLLKIFGVLFFIFTAATIALSYKNRSPKKE